MNINTAHRFRRNDRCNLPRAVTIQTAKPMLKQFEDSWRDVRHGFRMLSRAPGFTAAALLTLALGIGATAAIFNVARTVLLEPLPYGEPDRIVSVWETNRGGTVRNVISAANFVAWRERTRTLDHLGMVGPANLTIIIDGNAQRILGNALSADVFSALGVQPLLGRAYTAQEDFGGGNAVIVLGHQFWRRRLGGRTDVLGLTLATDRGPRTVIGVMPPDFTIVGEKADFLIPYSETIEQLRAISGRGNSYAIARLANGVSFDQAVAEMRSIYADLEREVPQRNARRTVMLFHVQEQMVGDVRPAVVAMTVAVMFVLLVACVNVANLLLARSAARAREIGMRSALGANRGRLVRQMITESLILAAGGGLGGLVIAALCQRGLLALVSDQIPIPRLDQLSFDLPMILLTTIVALVTGMVFGVAPALVSTTAMSDALRDGGRHGGGRRLHHVLRTLVVAEVALSLVLLAGAGLLMRSFVKLQRVDPGFRSERVLTAEVKVPEARYSIERANSFFIASLSRITELPGVQQAAASLCPPLPGSCIGTSFWRADRPRPADGQLTSGHVRPITPLFFSTLAIPHVGGRDFTESDTMDSPPVAIVSEALAREQFPDGSPLGRRLHINVEHASGRSDVEWTIVGVVASIRSSLDGPVRQTIYIPIAQHGTRSMRLFIRTAQNPKLLAPTVASTVHAIEPEAPVEIRTLEDIVGGTIARPRATSVIVGVFAIVALALAAVGVYGVMAYSVRERTQEIGVRMALGATAMSVFRLVLGQAIRLVLGGIVVGLIAGAMLTRLLQRLLYEVEPLDPWTFALTSAVLLTIATIASYVPARRSMRMPPVDALRSN